MKLFASFLSLFMLPTLIFAGPDAAMQARVAAALASATLSKPSSPSTVKTAICYCDPECTCPCTPNCPCTNGCYIKTEHGVYKVSGGTTTKWPAFSCKCGAYCQCTNGECGDPNCPSLARSRNNGASSPGPMEWAMYLVQYNKALRDNKPLIIWVGETCPSCENQWTNYIHARLSEYDPEKGSPIYGPKVIVAKPDGLGGMTIAGQLDGIPSLSQVQNILTPAQTVAYQPPQQTFYYQPPPMTPMMMGGFGGGGCFGGGCGAGG